MTRHVLVPTDGSPLARQALRHALREFPDADITVLHVVDLFEPTYGEHQGFEPTYEHMMGTAEWYEATERVTDAVLGAARDLAADYGREVETDSDIGDVDRVVLSYAEEEDVDHIVLGAHGREGADRPFFGSVADTVARRASVPVTLVR
jgi:nucleotide-binding universal stress UspA family protein